ncbi:hypothetical protein [Pseudomonas sp. PDM20]|uniref:hypothetical protein n=1 Tax=Pseudomonas sp. PDM20 TaxID=2769254 RepID=UPI003CFD3D7D
MHEPLRGAAQVVDFRGGLGADGAELELPDGSCQRLVAVLQRRPGCSLPGLIEPNARHRGGGPPSVWGSYQVAANDVTVLPLLAPAINQDAEIGLSTCIDQANSQLFRGFSLGGAEEVAVDARRAGDQHVARPLGRQIRQVHRVMQFDARLGVHGIPDLVAFSLIAISALSVMMSNDFRVLPGHALVGLL